MPIEPSSQPKISSFVVCCNDEKRIRRCLESVKWCDEIIVVDSGSTDSTLEICREYTDRIIQRPWPGFVAQKRFALEQCRGEWVLNIDADERVSAELVHEFETRFESPELQEIDGFYIPRKTWYLNRWVMHGGWYPNYLLRLARRDRSKWTEPKLHE